VCCIAFVGVFVWAMLKLAMCTIAFGMGAEAFQPIAEVANFSNTLGEAPWDVIVVGLALRTLFLITWLLVWALAASYKFSSMTLTYFILRRDVDGARMDEVYLPEPEAETEPSQATLESSENAAAGKDDVKQA
jgi:hypothetical protein